MKTEKAFLELYDELAEPLFRHCYFRVSSREVAEDLVQESFMRMWNYVSEGKAVDNPRAFLYRVAGNLVIDHYRKKKETSLDTLADEGFDPVGTGAQEILDHADGAYATTLLEQLEPHAREVLVLRYVNGLSIGEIAEIIGESDNTVSVRIHRAIEKLKKLFHHGQPT